MNVNAPALSGTMDLDEFMAFVQTRPKGEHWDLIDGVAVRMAPASHAHRQIAINLCITKRHKWEPLIQDAAAKAQALTRIAINSLTKYPMAVYCWLSLQHGLPLQTLFFEPCQPKIPCSVPNREFTITC